jgi:WD40 repeat protein
VTTTARSHKNPYIGPQSFGRGDALYGRDREVVDLLDLLIAERVVLLHSPSGAGKTSLIEARLHTLLEDEGFEVLPLIRLNHEVPPSLRDQEPPVNRYVLSALLSLEEGLPAELRRPVPELARTSLAHYVAQWPDLDNRPGNEVLIFDQFEEVLTADRMDHDAKADFFADLGSTLRDRSLWALFSMREDFVAELDPYLRDVPTRFSTTFRLDLLTVEQALEAVRSPAHDAGVEFEEDAAVKLVDDLRRVRTQRGTGIVEELGRHVEPVQLQVVCRQVWDGIGDARRISADDIESAGDVNQALAGYYAASVAEASRETGVPERALRDWFERELVTAQGFRGQVLNGPEAAGDAGGRVLELLTAGHLLRAESRRGAIWYELSHDRLTQPIAEDNARWRAVHLSNVERWASEWDRHGRPDRLLVVGQDLDQARRWASTQESVPTRVERDFLAASTKAQRQRDNLVREAVRTRRWLRISIGLLVLALATAALAVVSAVRASDKSEEAEQAAGAAEQNALVAAGLGETSFDNQLSIMLTSRALSSESPATSPSSWDAANALQLALTSSPVVRRLGERDSVDTIARWSTDGARAATADDQGNLRVVDTTSGDVIAQASEVGEVGAVAVSPPDGGTVAVGLENGPVLLWNTSEDAAPAEITRHSGTVYDVEFSPDGSMVASAGAAAGGTGTVVVSNRSERVRSFAVNAEVNAVAWSADGRRVYAVDDTGAMNAWDVASGRRVGRATQRHSEIAIDVDISNDGTRVVTGGFDGVVAISALGSRARPVEVRTPSGGRVRAVSFTSDGGEILVLDEFGSIEVIDAHTGDSIGTVTSAGQGLTSIEASPHGTGRAVVATGDSAAAIWDTELGHRDHFIVTVDHLDDGRLMSAAYRDDTVLLWSPDGQRIVDRRRVPGATFWDAAIDPRGTFVVHTTEDGEARLTPLVDGGRARPLGPGVEVEVSASGRLVATAGVDSDVYIWDSRSGRRIAVLDDHTDTVTALDFGPGDDQLVTSSADGRVILWDVGQAKALRTIRAQDDVVTSVEWDPTGSLLALGRESGAVELIQADGQQRPVDLDWHSDRVNDLDFSADGAQLVSVGQDGYTVVWDVRTSEMVRAIKHNSLVYRASFSPDGGYLLISGSTGKPVTVWLDPEELQEVAGSRVTRPFTRTECHRYLPDDPRCGDR